MSLITTNNENRNKIFSSVEKFKNNFINNKISSKYYTNTNWLVKLAIRNELSDIVCRISELTEEQIEFLKNQCNFIQCKNCKIYKQKNLHCIKCKIIKKANLIEINCINDSCSICLETLGNCVLTSCNHKFHKLCLYNVLIKKNECPLCRNSVSV
jgi:hypothetical protein